MFLHGQTNLMQAMPDHYDGKHWHFNGLLTRSMYRSLKNESGKNHNPIPLLCVGRAPNLFHRTAGESTEQTTESADEDFLALHPSSAHDRKPKKVRAGVFFAILFRVPLGVLFCAKTGMVERTARRKALRSYRMCVDEK